MRSYDNRRVLVATLFSNFSQFGSRVVISPFVLTIATTFNASKGEIGAVLTVLWAVFACLQFPSGVLADRFGERRIILVSMSLTTIGSLAIALAQSILGFAFAALVLGIGTGLYFSVGSSLLARLYENSGQVLGLHSAGAPLAGLVFPSVAVTVGTWFSWRVGVALGAVGSSLAAVFVAIFVTPTPAVSPEISLTERLSSTTLRSVFSQPSVIFVTIIATIGMYAFQALVSFFPTFLVEYHGFNERTASLGFGLLFLFIIIGLPAFGRVGDQAGLDYGIALPLGLATVGLTMLLLGSVTVVVPAIALLGFGVTWSGALQARFMTLFSSDRLGTGFGLVRTTFVLLGSLGNVVTGAAVDLWGWLTAYGIVAVVLLSGMILVICNHLGPEY